MFFKQYYLGCLAHASYIIASNGEAAIVDPQRDIDQYVADLEEHNLTLRYVFQTHIHADFVSGHLELQKRKGGEIVFGDRAQDVQFPFHAAPDGEVLPVGDAQVKVLATPGHTPESVSYLVTEPGNPDEPARLLTGDTLFVGEVGRPDLAGSRGFTAAQMAGMLYDSLRGKIATLPGETMVFPAHGAGSLCGKNISDKSFSTIAEQLKTNYALQDMTRDEFVNMATDNLPEVPDYFPRSVDLNRAAIPELKDLARPAALAPTDFKAKADSGALVLDVRESFEYGSGHVPGSLAIPLGGQYASWAGTIIQPDQDVLLVVNDEDEVDQAQMRLARIGLHNAVGYLAGGIQAWDEAGLSLATLDHVDVDEAEALINQGARVIDVRRIQEYAAGHIPQAENMPLDKLADLAREVADTDRTTVVICRSGYRSTIGSSILEQLGYTDLHNLVGGFTAWSKADKQAEPVA